MVHAAAALDVLLVAAALAHAYHLLTADCRSVCVKDAVTAIFRAEVVRSTVGEGLLDRVRNVTAARTAREEVAHFDAVYRGDLIKHVQLRRILQSVANLLRALFVKLIAHLQALFRLLGYVRPLVWTRIVVALLFCVSLHKQRAGTRYTKTALRPAGIRLEHFRLARVHALGLYTICNLDLLAIRARVSALQLA